MKKSDAAEKVAKLRRLAEGSKNPHEAESARKQADKIAQENGLTEDDLSNGRCAAAFDDLVGAVEEIVDNAPIPRGLFDTGAIIREVTSKIRNLGEDDKAKKMRQVATGIRVAAMIAGNNQTVAELKAVLDAVIKNHELKI